MTSTSSTPTYDPVSTATALAQKYTQAAQDIQTKVTSDAAAQQTALGKLESALLAFQGTLSGLTGLNQSMYAQSATLSDSSIGAATASATAASGTYSFFVQQIATAHQVAFDSVPSAPTMPGGTLVVNLGQSSPYTGTFSVDLSTADSDHDGTLTVRELAAAINTASGNSSLVSAAVVTVGTVQQLVLTAKNTGTANTISLDASGVSDANLKAALTAPRVVVAPLDAIVWLGAKGTGTQVTQSSNTFTNIDGLKATFTKAQGATDAPVTITVATDSAATTRNVQNFVDAYNILKGVVDGLVDPGDPNNNKAAGAFAEDSSMRSLRDALVTILRPAGATSLALYGITSAKDGTLTLDSTRLSKELAIDPAGLNTLFGSTAAGARSGIADKLDTYLKAWSDAANGTIKKRQDVVTSQQDALTKKQKVLDAQYDSAYQRYLQQFTALQVLQSQMSNNQSMFDSLFGNSKSN
jgi:flagellar hook-associated protein 2